MADVYHIPALADESIEGLNINPDGTYIDLTFGGGGHSRLILSHLSPKGRLFSFDQDADAKVNLIDDERFCFVESNFRFLRSQLRLRGVEDGQVDGVLADLGVSSHHFDDASRGFSFRADGPLDMRMNAQAPLSAADIVATADVEELARYFKIYGELARGYQIARAIVEERAKSPVDTTGRLVEVASRFISPAHRKKELAQLFQALRIVVNGEMEALEAFLTQAVDVLRPGGRLAVITYHSLEDRMVKNFMRSGRIDGEVTKDLFGRVDSPLKPLWNKPVVPGEAEIEANPRSRSAKLRVAVKTAAEPSK